MERMLAATDQIRPPVAAAVMILAVCVAAWAAPPGMTLVPSGTFQMGDALGDGTLDEQPVHSVQLGPCFLDACEVTNHQYASALNWAAAQGRLITVTGGTVYKYGAGTTRPYCQTTASSAYSQITWNGDTFGVVSGRETHPLVLVTWYGAAAYANWRSASESKPLCYDLSTWVCSFGPGYRLPTEAEWERAARGGAIGHRFEWTDADTIQHARANYYSETLYPYDTSPTRGYHPAFRTQPVPYTAPVAYFAPNAYGLYDMAGNVWEWCNDWYSDAYYSSSPAANPTGPASGLYRTQRGGSWNYGASGCRVANRYENMPTYADDLVGFRCAISYAAGDINCDGLVNTFDIDPFVLALTSPASYAARFPECDYRLADVNADGAVNTFDIDPFVVLLTH